MKVEYKDKVPINVELSDQEARQAILEFAQRTLNIPITATWEHVSIKNNDWDEHAPAEIALTIPTN